MGKKKTIEIYGSFEDWIIAHEKYSSLSVECALEDSMEDPENGPMENLKSYISRLEDMRSEINSEIQEARDWLEYLGKQGR